jgi:hypothetical protein
LLIQSKIKGTSKKIITSAELSSNEGPFKPYLLNRIIISFPGPFKRGGCEIEFFMALANNYLDFFSNVGGWEERRIGKVLALGHPVKKAACKNEVRVLDFGSPSISGSIQSIKMYSWAECAMQKGLVCRDMYPENPRGAGIGPPPL